jgi:hypothetical protein
MMSYEDLLIREENTKGPMFAAGLDDHERHIGGHLPYAWNPVIMMHIVMHALFMAKAKSFGAQRAQIDDMIKAQERLGKDER